MRGCSATEFDSLIRLLIIILLEIREIAKPREARVKGHKPIGKRKHIYRVARNFGGSLFLWIGDFLCFAGTNFCD